MMSAEAWSELSWRSGDGDGDWIYRKAPAASLPVGSKAYPKVAFVTVSFQAGARVGQPPDAEVEALEEFVATLAEMLAREQAAIHVAEVHKRGMRDLVFYTGSASSFEALLQMLRPHWPQFTIVHAVFDDPLWTQYQEMP